MNSADNSKTSSNNNVLSSLAGLLFLFQLLLLFFYSNYGGNTVVLGIGWFLVVPSFALLMVSSSVLREFDIIRENSNQVHAQPLVKNGIYGLVRHPLNLGWMLMSASFAMITQYWLSCFLSLIVIPTVLKLTYLEESLNIVKFGNAYSLYQKEVPMLNIIKGLWDFHARKS